MKKNYYNLLYSVTHLFLSLCIFLLLVFNPILSKKSEAGGISVDAGLTAPEDRWISRAQFRLMSRENDPTPMGRSMETTAFMALMGYGLFPDLTVMAKQVFKQRTMRMNGSKIESNGRDDFFLMGKYKLLRINARDYKIGISGLLGLEVPTGSKGFSSETWDLKTGVFVSLRFGYWASDFTMTYVWNGFSDKTSSGKSVGDEVTVDLAIAHQFTPWDSASMSLSPVLEFSFKHASPDNIQGVDVTNTGESLLVISPGIKFTHSSFISEALIQVPVWQSQTGSQLEMGLGGLLGIRYMF